MSKNGLFLFVRTDQPQIHVAITARILVKIVLMITFGGVEIVHLFDLDDPAGLAVLSEIHLGGHAIQ